MAESTPRSIKMAGWGFLILILFLFFEILSFAALSFAPQLQRFLYKEPVVTEEQYTSYLDRRHPTLGWLSKFNDTADDDGARASPANEKFKGQAACISLYGDSFTFGEEVEPDKAWSNLMAEDLGCRVANFGIGGYGVTQAQLRLEDRIEAGVDQGDVVILGIFPDDLNRMVNQWRYLLSGARGGALTLKPAVVVEAGKARLEPIFSGDFSAFEALGRIPSAVFPNEPYLPGNEGLYRPVRVGFPYSATLFQVVARFGASWRGYDGDVGMARANYPTYYDTKDGPAEEKKVALRFLAERFSETCARSGAECVWMLIPNPELMYQLDTGGQHDLEWVLDAAPEGVLAIDATEMFANMNALCQSLVRPGNCAGHFNAAGNRVFADFTLSKLAEADLTPSR